ncbi:hypothetical protein BH24ACI3_BH24ACI3_14110 [soil metagenome]
MTSEELELSLRAEFENYLSNKLGALQQDVAEFQKSFEAEFSKHKSQMDEAIKALSSRLETVPELDRGFTESVVEHLRLARDEGAELTAHAFGEAEKLKEEAAPTEGRYDILRDAISDISSQLTQAAILRSLVQHAGKFAPRGAFFIVKNEQFVGWRGFGNGVAIPDEQIQAIRFPTTSETLPAKAVSSLTTAEGVFGANADDELFLEPLGFGRPARMYAIPLTARGRGVAVLYADYGIEGIALNLEALETLVNVAGLTVELRATAHAASLQAVAVPAETSAPSYVPSEEVEKVDEAADAGSNEDPAETGDSHREGFQQESFEQPKYEPTQSDAYQPQEPEMAYPQVADDLKGESFAQYDDGSVIEEQSPFSSPAGDFETAGGREIENNEYMGAVVYDEPETDLASVTPTDGEPYQSEVVEFVEPEQPPQHIEIERGFADEPVDSEPSNQERFPAFAEYEQETFQPVAESEDVNGSPTDVASSTPEPIESVQSPVLLGEAPSAAEAAEVSVGGNSHAVETAKPAVEVASQFRGRFSERMIDLPIEVPEEERKLHNNARRFARLLVSEIKLYNEQKVVEGREAGDLYDRLREAIDRSREMYDKRVESHVAAQFDYFHYELLNSLADGEPTKLGSSYPGAVV